MFAYCHLGLMTSNNCNCFYFILFELHIGQSTKNKQTSK